MINWIDLICISYLSIYFVIGLKKDFFSILTNISSLIFSLILSVYTYNYTAIFLSQIFSLNGSYAKMLGFFLNIFILKIFMLLLIRKVLSKHKPKINNFYIDRMATGLTSLLVGILTIFLLFSITLSFSLPYFIDKEIRSSAAEKIVGYDLLGINASLKKIFGNVLSTTVDKLTFLTLEESESDKIVNLGYKTSSFKFDAKLENEMLALINAERKTKGLDEYISDEKIKNVARKHGADMFEKGYFSHTDLERKKPLDRLKAGGVEFIFSGENLALSKNLISAHQGLMNSPNHKKNILHPFYHRIGIGAIDAGPHGIIFVQNFAD